MQTPPLLQEFYKLIMNIQGWILFPLLVIMGIIILVRGFTIWRKTGGDWQASFKSLESLFSFFVVILIAYSVFNSYAWLRKTDIGSNLPDLTSQYEDAKKD